jgi:hypothetical protein
MRMGSESKGYDEVEHSMPEMTMTQIRERIEQQRSQLYVVLMQPTDRYDTASDEGRELLRRHLQWQLEMQDRGLTLGAGPFGSLGGAQTQAQFEGQVASQREMLNASGMYVLAVPSLEAAEAIARSEPFEAAGWRRHAIVLWNLNEGAAWQLAQELLARASAGAH